MTNEELRQKYRLMQLVAKQGVRSYHALDGAGHLCMVHYLPGASEETAHVLALLDVLSTQDRTRILDRVQVDGAPVVITQLIPGFESLTAWLQTRTERTDAGPPAPAPSRGAGQLTQMFGPPNGEKAPLAQEPPQAPVTPASPGLAQLFGAGAAGALPSLPAQPSPERPDDKPTVRWRDKPGSSSDRPVVRWKDGGDEAPRPPLPAPPAPLPAAPPGKPSAGRPPSKPAGELTQLFGAPGGAGVHDPVPPLPSPSPLSVADPWRPGGAGSPLEPPSAGAGAGSAPPGITPGEFTRLFQPAQGLGVPPANMPGESPAFGVEPAAAPPTPPPAPQASPAHSPGDFTRLMSVGPVGGAGGAPAPPGEFTRMIGAAPAAPPAPAPAMPLAAPVADPTRRSPRLVTLMLALGLLAIAALALVLYFALK